MNRLLACLFVAVCSMLFSFADVSAGNNSAFDATGIISAIAKNSDAAFSRDVARGWDSVSGMEIPQAGIPELLPSVSVEPAAIRLEDYFPLQAGAKFRYEHTSSEFDGKRIVTVEILDVASRNGGLSARVKMMSGDGTKSGDSLYIITRNDREVFSGGSILGGERREFVLPLAVGKRWNDASDVNQIVSLDAAVSVPAGAFKNCMKIATRIGGGDAGTATRIYAPGVGLVFEENESEGTQDTIKLVSYTTAE